MLRKFLVWWKPLRGYAADLVILPISRPGAYVERLTDPQPSVEFVLGFPMIEKHCWKILPWLQERRC